MTRNIVTVRTFVALFFAFLIGTAFAASSDEGTQRVERFIANLQTLQADFKQTLTDSKGQVTDRSSGTLAIQRPNRFRWDYKEPHEQLIVADGQQIWLYDADLEQVTVRRLDTSLSATPAMLLSGEGKLADNFKVTETSRDANAEWVMMEPKRSDTDFKWVRLGFGGDTLKFMQLADKLGQITTLEFTSIQKNATLDASRFKFTPPAGADVIGEPAASSGK
jgi:outer membrane lipoprotein carrier protein